MIVSQIAAMSRNRVIGVKNALPWHLPEDMKFFREKTAGHIIIMGRKTFESMGGNPMPKRLNVIITRQADYRVAGAHVFTSVETALEFAKAEAEKSKQWGDEIFVCGGEEIYRQMLPLSDRIYLTVIDRDFEGDAHFPEFDTGQFILVDRKDRTEPENFAFLTYQRQPSV